MLIRSTHWYAVATLSCETDMLPPTPFVAMTGAAISRDMGSRVACLPDQAGKLHREFLLERMDCTGAKSGDRTCPGVQAARCWQGLRPPRSTGCVRM